MSDLRTALRTTLSHDTALAAILTGGVFDAQTTDAEGVSSQWLPRAANGITLNPFAVIRFRSASVTEIIARTERRFVEIYFYQSGGYSLISQAQRRVKALLHQQQLQADDAGIALFHLVLHRGEWPAPEYENAASDMSRYYVDYVAK